MTAEALFETEPFALTTEVEAPTVKATERYMLNALHRRYHQVSQGVSDRWAAAEHVRNAAGFNANRTCDFIALDLWPSYGKGLQLHGHEVKCSRSDWLVELKDASKADAFTRYVDYWWLVVSDAQIVKPGELPPHWGLLALTPRGLRRIVQAQRLLHESEPPRSFWAAFSRSLVASAEHRAEALA